MYARLRNCLLLFALLFAACSPRYELVKSNRNEYAIDQKIDPDSSIIRTYLPYKTQLDAEMNKVIGYSDVDLTKRTDIPESVLGNFFADAVFAQAKKVNPDIDFALPTTKGGLRNDISKGPITVSKVFELMPFENELVLFKLSGKDVLEVLKFIAATGGQPVAGLKMKIVNKLPEQVTINDKAFDVNKDYMVLTSDYIASGGDNARGFAAPISKNTLGLKVRDALLKAVAEQEKNGKKIHTTLDGRITKD